MHDGQHSTSTRARYAVPHTARRPSYDMSTRTSHAAPHIARQPAYDMSTRVHHAPPADDRPTILWPFVAVQRLRCDRRASWDGPNGTFVAARRWHCGKSALYAPSNGPFVAAGCIQCDKRPPGSATDDSLDALRRRWRVARHPGVRSTRPGPVHAQKRGLRRRKPRILSFVQSPGRLTWSPPSWPRLRGR